MAAIVNERTQYLDEAGKPFVGGFVFIGDQNADPEVSPKDIFSDRELTSALTQPVTLDDFGRAENKIWTDGRYSLRVRDIDLDQVLLDLDRGEEASTGVTSLGNVQGANMITAEASATITEYIDLEEYVFAVAETNTDEVTMDIDGVGETSVVKNIGEALDPGDFTADQRIVLLRNETNDVFQWVNRNADAGGFSTLYLEGGYITRRNNDASNFYVTPGVARDSTDTFDMALPAFTKEANQAWVVGNSNGALFDGSLASFEAYNIYAILLDSDEETVDYGCDLVANGTDNLPTGYSTFRLIGRFYTDDSAAIMITILRLLGDTVSTQPDGLVPQFDEGFFFGGVMSIGSETVSIDSVDTNGGFARFNFTAGPTMVVGETVTMSGFTTNTDYNVTTVVSTVAAGAFTCNAITFGSDESIGSFTHQDLNTIAITEGVARDDLNTFDMVGAAMTKDISSTWVVGDGNGGLFSGTVAADTTYFFFAIRRQSDGVVDYGWDTSATAANIPTGYRAFRLVSRTTTDSNSVVVNSMQGKFLSEPNAVLIAQTDTFRHDLGFIPKTDYFMLCVIADGGHVVGNRIKIPNGYQASTAPSNANITTNDTVTFDVDWGDTGIFTINKTGTAVLNINASPTSWRYFATGEAQ